MKDSSQHCFAGKHGATESITCSRDRSCRRAKSNQPPELGIEMENEGSIPYAKIAQ
jgi:hypothetical protein